MKVLLTAFHRKLQGTMELPDNWDHRDIYLMMDMDIIDPWTNKEPSTVTAPLKKSARFQYSGMGQFIDGKAVYEYKLVAVS